MTQQRSPSFDILMTFGGRTLVAVTCCFCFISVQNLTVLIFLYKLLSKSVLKTFLQLDKLLWFLAHSVSGVPRDQFLVQPYSVYFAICILALLSCQVDNGGLWNRIVYNRINLFFQSGWTFVLGCLDIDNDNIKTYQLLLKQTDQHTSLSQIQTVMYFTERPLKKKKQDRVYK